jgi:transposase
LLYKAGRPASSLTFRFNIRMGKKRDLRDFERGMIVGSRRAGSSISQTAALLGFSRTAVSVVYREWRDKQKTSSQRQSSGRKQLVDKRGRMRLERIVQTNRRATIRQITAQYNSGVQNCISECTTRRSLSRMGYSSRRRANEEWKNTACVDKVNESMQHTAFQRLLDFRTFNKSDLTKSIFVKSGPISIYLAVFAA